MAGVHTARWQHLTNSIYQEIVIDGPSNVDAEGIQNFLEVVKWRLSGSISENEFSELHGIWLSTLHSELISKTAPPFSKGDMRKLLIDSSEMELFVTLGLLIREHNYSLLLRGRSPEWIQLVERLFWIMDSTGRGLLTQDEMLFLLLAIVGSDVILHESSVRASQVQQHTCELMKEFDVKHGVITLRRFKTYFDRHDLDEQAVLRSITSLEALLERVCGTTSDFRVPCKWEQAVELAQEYLRDSLVGYDDATLRDIVDFLLVDAVEVRFGCISEKPFWKLSLQLFKEFTILYEYVSPVEYTKDSIFKDQDFMLIQQTLRLHYDLLTEMLLNLYPTPVGHSDNSLTNTDIGNEVSIPNHSFENTSDYVGTPNEFSYINKDLSSLPNITPLSTTTTSASILFGEYTTEQLEMWLQAANWVDVMVNEAHSFSSNTTSSGLVGNSNGPATHNFDRDQDENLLSNNTKPIPDHKLTQKHPTTADQYPKNTQNKPAALFDSSLTVDNITPTYLQTILSSTPTSSGAAQNHSSRLSGSKDLKFVKEKQPSRTLNKLPMQDNTFINAPAVGSVPISRIPHKGTVANRKILQNSTTTTKNKTYQKTQTKTIH